jgi:hypothetical protein
MTLEVLIALLSPLMVMIPLWRITRRTGRDPWLSLLFLGAPIGPLVLVALLSFGHWPAESGRGGQGGDGAAGGDEPSGGA